MGLPGGVALGLEKRLLGRWCVDKSLLREEIVLGIEKRRLQFEKARAIQ
jgi:hypothetical protein